MVQYFCPSCILTTCNFHVNVSVIKLQYCVNAVESGPEDVIAFYAVVELLMNCSNNYSDNLLLKASKQSYVILIQ